MFEGADMSEFWAAKQRRRLSSIVAEEEEGWLTGHLLHLEHEELNQRLHKMPHV